MKRTCLCHTPDCPNEGVPFEWDDAPDGDDAIQAEPWCGGCSTQFTDIVAAEDSGS